MRTILTFLMICVALAIPRPAHADYLRAFLSGGPGSTGPEAFERPAHLVLSGVGDELRTEIQQSAVTQALKYRDLDANAPVFLVAFIEGGFERNAERLRRAGFAEVTRVTRPFVDRNVVAEFLAFARIRSLDLFGHNSPHYGIQLQSKYFRLAPDSPGLEKLKPHFMPDAYGLLYGCNGGWIVAPTFSRRMGIPFAGSFASTDFEYLNTDGQYYSQNPGQYPRTPFETANAVSFFSKRRCDYGGCTRMKADNAPYIGKWGDLSGGGLNIFKFFCPGIAEPTCLRAMARSLFAFPSVRPIDARSSIGDFRAVAKDFLCPSQRKGERRRACADELDDYERARTRMRKIFYGREIQCDFSGCQARVVCAQGPDGTYQHGTCRVENRSPAVTTTREEEYLAYVRGFALLGLWEADDSN